MSVTRRSIRANVGRDLGIVYSGTSTSTPAGDLTLIDTSDDSPFDPGDTATRFNGAGLLMSDGTNLKYRQNVTYDPTTQKLTFVGTISQADTIYYEVHTEPLLNPLTIWPDLIDDALALIRRISWKHILLNNRGYYDLADFTDVTLVGHVRRLYNCGNNLLTNADFLRWPSGNNGPDNWTVSAALDREVVKNYAYAARCGDGESMYQNIPFGVASRRTKVSVWCTTGAGATATLTLTTRLADGSAERTVTATQAESLSGQIEAEIESTNLTSQVRVALSSAGGTADFWAPMAYDQSVGRRRRVQPITTLEHDGLIKMFIPKNEVGCGQMALLLPYAALGNTTTDAADIATTSAPKDLIESAVSVTVLTWLSKFPGLPVSARREYGLALTQANGDFTAKMREYVRKLSKTPSMWEIGELN